MKLTENEAMSFLRHLCRAAVAQGCLNRYMTVRNITRMLGKTGLRHALDYTEECGFMPHSVGSYSGDISHHLDRIFRMYGEKLDADTRVIRGAGYEVRHQLVELATRKGLRYRDHAYAFNVTAAAEEDLRRNDSGIDAKDELKEVRRTGLPVSTDNRHGSCWSHGHPTQLCYG